MLDVTEAVSAPGERLLPIGDEPSEGFYGRRYVRVGDPLDKTFVALGVVPSWAQTDRAALWLRFHRATSGLDQVRNRLTASPWWSAARAHRGHIWIPVAVPTDVAGIELVQEVEAFARQIASVAAPPGFALRSRLEPLTDSTLGATVRSIRAHQRRPHVQGDAQMF